MNVVTPWGLVVRGQRSIFRTGSLCFSETLVSTHKSTWSCNAEDLTRRLRSRENLNYHNFSKKYIGRPDYSKGEREFLGT